MSEDRQVRLEKGVIWTGKVMHEAWSESKYIGAERSEERVKALVWVCGTKMLVRRVWNRRQISDLHPSPDLALALQK